MESHDRQTNFTPMVYIEGKIRKGNVRVTYLTNFREWITEQGQRILNAQKSLGLTKDRKLWRTVIKYALKELGT